MAVAYVQIEGVPGESTNSAHAEWIETSEFNHKLQQRGSQSAGVGAMVRDRAAGTPFKFWKKVDKASPVLMERCLAGEHLEKVTIDMVRVSNSNTETYMKVELEKAIITEVESTVNGSGDVGEWVSLLPQKVKWVYTAHKDGKPTGNTPGGWNYQEDKKYS